MSVDAAAWCVICGGPPEAAITVERGGVLGHYGACFAHLEQVAARVRAEHGGPPVPRVQVGGSLGAHPDPQTSGSARVIEVTGE